MEDSEVHDQTGPTKTRPDHHNTASWSNGQQVLAVPSGSMFNPAFDLSLCRAALEKDGFQVPVGDLEAPLRAALEVPSVRRYMVFNSSMFHFIMAPVLYMVLWCGVFSTLHLYVTVTDYWVLCLSVTLVSIVLTSVLTWILHRSNKEINVNVDVRLVQVNERMVKHKLLVGVADWVQSCTGNMKLYFVYWDVSPCLRALTETLEESSFVSTDIQNKLENKLSYLVLATEVVSRDEEQDSGEQRPLLGSEDAACSTTSDQRRGPGVTASYSLVPDASLPAQDKAFQLLMTYSSAYVKLLVSQRLTGWSHQRARAGRNHCTTAPLCLCQYLAEKILQ